MRQWIELSKNGVKINKTIFSDRNPHFFNISQIGTALNQEIYLDREKASFIEAVLKSQNDLQAFPNISQAKGAIGESLCHTLLEKIVPKFYFVSGQVGEHIGISTEGLSYKVAEKFFSQNPEYEYAIADRPFGGGQPYSLDVVEMLISRKDVANWNKNQQSTAIYFVFESKTDSSKLSEAQGQFSYVVNKASYMSRNQKHEDRSQLGNDLIKAANSNRVIYLTYHLDTKTGKVTARQIKY